MRSSGPSRRLSSWAADFETTTDENDCRVWSWGAEEVFTGKYYRGIDFDSFADWACDRHSRVYFHNLKFDGKFILPWLFQNDYTWTEDRNPRPGQFTTSIDKVGNWYSVIICWVTGKKTEIWDSLKKLPMSIAQMAKAFELEVVKGTIDYEKPRPVGYIPTPEEDEYQRNDCHILASALRVVLEEGATKMTVGSDSLSHFKALYGSKRWASTFPVLDPETDAELRLSYRGGWAYAAKRFRRKVLGKGRTFDVNSLYPSVMYNEFLPIGEPMLIDEMPDVSDKNKLFIFKVTIMARLKKDHLPCIQTKHNSSFVATEYLEDIEEPLDVWVTSVDWKLWNEHYDIDVVMFHSGYAFRGANGIFQKYIDYWMKIKKESTGGLRALAKLHLNSLYGKFGTSPLHQPQIPYMNDEGIVRYREGEETREESVYVPMAAFITAYARAITIRAAQAHYDEFVYADTDSLHLVGTGAPESLWIDPQELGAWKHEYDWQTGVFSRAKCYTEVRRDPTYREPISKRYETHIAGLPHAVASVVRLRHHVEGYVFGGIESPANEPRKLMPKTVPGGVVLKPGTFKLNV